VTDVGHHRERERRHLVQPLGGRSEREAGRASAAAGPQGLPI
jgi:hypothetical protein